MKHTKCRGLGYQPRMFVAGHPFSSAFASARYCRAALTSADGRPSDDRLLSRSLPPRLPWVGKLLVNTRFGSPSRMSEGVRKHIGIDNQLTGFSRLSNKTQHTPNVRGVCDRMRDLQKRHVSCLAVRSLLLWYVNFNQSLSTGNWLRTRPPGHSIYCVLVCLTCTT